MDTTEITSWIDANLPETMLFIGGLLALLIVISYVKNDESWTYRFMMFLGVIFGVIMLYEAVTMYGTWRMATSLFVTIAGFALVIRPFREVHFAVIFALMVMVLVYIGLGGLNGYMLFDSFDLTFLMADAGLSTGEGWSAAPEINYSCGEFFQMTFDFYQTIEGLPAGTYQFKGQGFQRPGAASAVYNAYTEGQNDVTAVIYAGADEQQLAHIASEARTSKLGGSESAVGSAPVKYIPNDMQAASLYFAAGLYENGVVTELTEDESDLQVGIRNDYTAESWARVEAALAAAKAALGSDDQKAVDAAAAALNDAVAALEEAPEPDPVRPGSEQKPGNESTKPVAGSDSNMPRTGDSSLPVMGAALGAAGALAVGLLVRRRSERS